MLTIQTDYVEATLPAGHLDRLKLFLDTMMKNLEHSERFEFGAGGLESGEEDQRFHFHIFLHLTDEVRLGLPGWQKVLTHIPLPVDEEYRNDVGAVLAMFGEHTAYVPLDFNRKIKYNVKSWRGAAKDIKTGWEYPGKEDKPGQAYHRVTFGEITGAGQGKTKPLDEIGAQIVEAGGALELGPLIETHSATVIRHINGIRATAAAYRNYLNEKEWRNCGWRPCLVVLVGDSGVGKSQFCERVFKCLRDHVRCVKIRNDAQAGTTPWLENKHAGADVVWVDEFMGAWHIDQWKQCSDGAISWSSKGVGDVSIRPKLWLFTTQEKNPVHYWWRINTSHLGRRICEQDIVAVERRLSVIDLNAIPIRPNGVWMEDNVKAVADLVAGFFKSWNGDDVELAAALGIEQSFADIVSGPA